MLTVKLHYAHTPLPAMGHPNGTQLETFRFGTKIVEAESVDIRELRNNELFEVAVHRSGLNAGEAFYVAPRDKPRPDGFADCVDFYYEAFIENASGKTVERLRFD